MFLVKAKVQKRNMFRVFPWFTVINYGIIRKVKRILCSKIFTYERGLLIKIVTLLKQFNKKYVYSILI